MIRIVNDKGLTLDLKAEKDGAPVTITVERNNPLFNNADELFQDMSWPFTVPFTENNKIFCGMGHLVEAKNVVYSQPVHFQIDGVPLSAGNLRYRVGQNGYEANLEPNFAAITSLLKGVRMTEIPTEDAIFNFATPSAYQNIMLDSAQNPDKYPFIFFPVYNPGWHGLGTGVGRTDWINYFTGGAFFAYSPNPSDDASFKIANTPFWKVTYILQQVANYLGFSATGGFFADTRSKNICIYTRKTHSSAVKPEDRYIAPSFSYMPNMLVSDFLKQIRERLHIAIDFDLLSREMVCESFNSIRTQTPFNLTAFILEGIEIEQPEKKGYTVSLKSDEQDGAMQVLDPEGNEAFLPLYKLIADNGEVAVDLECSTTNILRGTFDNFPKVNQSVFNGFNYQHLIQEYPGKPEDMEYTDPSDPSTLNNWPLRLINYVGWTDLGGGVFYPQALPLDLDDADVAYYRFLNDAKRLLFTASMPPSILANMRSTKQYTHRSAGGNYVTYLLEKMIYDAGSDSDLVPVKLYGRQLGSEIDTKVAIVPLPDYRNSTGGDSTEAQMRTRFKAYFDPTIHGITKVEMRVFNTATSADISGPLVIDNPTNKEGTGGAAVVWTMPGTAYRALPGRQLRVYDSKPAYLLVNGKRYTFTAGAGYVYLNLVDGAGTYFFIDTYRIFF